VASRSASTSSCARALFLRVAAALAGGLGDERAEALAAVDDPLALELFVGAFDGDDADEQVLGEHAERGSAVPGVSRPSLTSRLRPSTICWYERAGRGRRDGRNDQLARRGGHGHCIY
jgi:hypothetical protein